MTLTIAKTATFTCNGCGETVEMGVGHGHPPGWGKLEFSKQLSGHDAVIRHDLCRDCTSGVEEFMAKFTK